MKSLLTFAGMVIIFRSARPLSNQMTPRCELNNPSLAFNNVQPVERRYDERRTTTTTTYQS
jgi:hypothetical protein